MGLRLVAIGYLLVTNNELYICFAKFSSHMIFKSALVLRATAVLRQWWCVVEHIGRQLSSVLRLLPKTYLAMASIDIFWKICVRALKTLNTVKLVWDVKKNTGFTNICKKVHRLFVERYCVHSLKVRRDVRSFIEVKLGANLSLQQC